MKKGLTALDFNLLNAIFLFTGILLYGNIANYVAAVKDAAASPGVSAVIFRAPCIAVAGKLGHKFPAPRAVDAGRCVGCRKCVSELGCPAISIDAGTKKPVIDRATCTACGLCAQICPVQAIHAAGEEKDK